MPAVLQIATLGAAPEKALAERVPPGRPEGGQFSAKVTRLTSHDTPAQQAEAINAMNERQRAQVRASILTPPGHDWVAGDRLAEAK